MKNLKSNSSLTRMTTSTLLVLAIATCSYGQGNDQQKGSMHENNYIVVPPDPVRDNMLRFYYEESTKALKEGKLALAERIARNGLSFDPDNVRFRMIRGESLLRLGNNKEALRCFLQVSTVFSSEEVAAKLGLTYYRLGMFDKSYGLVSKFDLNSKVAKSDRAALPMPNTRTGLEQYWLIAAGLSTETSDYDSSIYYLEQVYKKNPSNNFINMKLGDLYMREERYKDAVGAYGRIKKGSERVVYEASQKKQLAEKKLKSIDKSVDKIG